MSITNKMEFYNYIKRQLGAPLLHIELEDEWNVTFENLTGTFLANEEISTQNGATARILTVGTSTLKIINIIGIFEAGDIITGATSGATSDLTILTASDSQIDYTINDAIDLFREYHTDALKENFIFLDVTTDTFEYDLPDNVFSIVDIFGRNTRNLFDFDSDADEDYLFSSSNFGIFNENYSAVDLEAWRQRYEMYRAEVKQDYMFDYSFLERKIRFLGELERDERLAIWVNQFIDDDDKTYSSRWFRRYCVALCGLLWAQNIGKYVGTKLPGAAEYNHEQIFSKYNEMKQELEEEIEQRYSEPFGFYIG